MVDQIGYDFSTKLGSVAQWFNEKPTAVQRGVEYLPC
jgi:hypothetical protein